LPRRKSVPVSPEGAAQLHGDDAFLAELVKLAPEHLTDVLDEEFDDSDAWWWICASLTRMKSYGRRDLKQTSRRWITRIRANDVYEIRDQAAEGLFDRYLPEVSACNQARHSEAT
jgi:hypothetical protein